MFIIVSLGPMYHLVLYELSRSGDVDVTPGKYGSMHVVTGSPLITAHAQSNSPNFEFTIPNQKGGEFKFTMADLGDSKLKAIEFKSAAGSVTLNVLLCVPFAKSHELETPMPVEFDHIITIGHRGCGSNLVVKDMCENTIAGFQEAKKRGAEYVEFDVQISKGNQAVIHHDFYVPFAEKHPEIGEPIKQDPETGKHLYACRQMTVEQFADSGLEKEWKIKLPTFEQVLKEVDPALKFDVEMKYPFHPRFHDVPFLERNEYVDRILEELLAFGGNRALFFSSFDIYVVMLLLLKQHRWPAFQLMTVEVGEDVPYFVSKTLAVAPLLKELGVKGYVVNSIHMLKVEHLVKELRDMGFLVFTYGDPNNTEEGVKHQRDDLGVTGFCSDKMEQLLQILKA